MSRFFACLAFLGSAAYLATLAVGHLGSRLSLQPSTHLLVALVAIVLCLAIHCLVFAIFTGSGKDTRLMVEDFSLDSELVKKTKKFKRTVFPPALYAIFWLILTAALGGMRSLWENSWVNWAHLLMGWYTLYYNLKTFLLEYRAINENALIIDRANRQATEAIRNSKKPLEVDTVPSEIEWGTHAYALGKFLCFLGWNVWLPYIYVRYIMAWTGTPFLPFFLTFLVCLGGGYYLRFSYKQFRPNKMLPT